MIISELVKLSPFLTKLADSGVDSFSRIKRVWELSTSRTSEILSTLKKHNLLLPDNNVNYDNYLTTLLIDTYNKATAEEIEILSIRNPYRILLAFHLQTEFGSVLSLSDATTISYATTYRNVKKLFKAGLIRYNKSLKSYSVSEMKPEILDFLENLIQYVYRQSLQYPKSVYSLIPLGSLVEDTYYISGEFARAELGYYREYITGLRNIIFCVPKAFMKFWANFFERTGISEIEFAEFDPKVKTVVLNGIRIKEMEEAKELIEEQIFVPNHKGKEIFFVRPELQTPPIKEALFLGWVGEHEKNVFISPSVLPKHIAITGMTGSGKSFTAGVLVEELEKSNIHSLIFDLYGEYDARLISETSIIKSPRLQRIRNEIKNKKIVIVSPSISSEMGTVDKIVNSLYDARFDGKIPPLVLLVESFDRFCPSENEEKRRALNRIARTGRKIGIGLIAVTQTISKVNPETLSQFNTLIIHRVTHNQDIELLKSLIPLTNAQVNKIKTMNFGECFIWGLSNKLEYVKIRQTRIVRASPFFG